MNMGVPDSVLVCLWVSLILDMAAYNVQDVPKLMSVCWLVGLYLGSAGCRHKVSRACVGFLMGRAGAHVVLGWCWPAGMWSGS